MQFDFTSKIAGIPLKELRKALNGPLFGGFNADKFAEILKIPKRRLPDVLKTLLAESYIELSELSRNESSYAIGILGTRLQASHLHKRFDRTTADRLIAGLLERANKINQDQHFPVCVGALDLFGSVITDRDDFGDVDVCSVMIGRENASHRHKIAYGFTFGPRTHYIHSLYSTDAIYHRRLHPL